MKNWLTTRQSILNTPLPVYGGKYAVIPHSVFLEEVQKELKNKGHNILEERYITTKDNAVISGFFKLKNDDSELAPSISFINSYNKQKKAGIRAGAVVLVCRNGMMGTIQDGSYSRKHMGSALEDFREHIVLVIGGLEKEFERLKINRAEMKRIILNPTTIASIVGDMLINEQLITNTQLGILRRELRKSQNFSGKTLWDFYNNCTEAFKETHPMYYETQHIKFHTYVCDKFQLTGHRGLFNPLKSEYETITTSEQEVEDSLSVLAIS